jgi:hypothetical protein
MTKRKGERGSPCLMPLIGEKVLEGTPFTNMETKDEELRLRTHLIHSSLNPKATRRECIYYQLSLLKDLEISSLMIISGVWEDFREWITSCARMMLSRIW